MNAIDASGVEAIEQLVRNLDGKSIDLVVARLKSPVRDRFDTTGLTELIGAANFFPTVERAVTACSR
jgi:MFS superfamily sulfate permease-like transporter